MEMTKQEILRNWEGAKDKKEQIKILADLNCTDTGTIQKILVEMGVDHRRLPRPRDKEKAAAPVVKKATAPAAEKAEAPVKQNKPTVEPRRKHDLRRMNELFGAIFTIEMDDGVPDKEWADEFIDLWDAYYRDNWGGED